MKFYKNKLHFSFLVIFAPRVNNKTIQSYCTIYEFILHPYLYRRNMVEFYRGLNDPQNVTANTDQWNNMYLVYNIGMFKYNIN